MFNENILFLLFVFDYLENNIYYFLAKNIYIIIINNRYNNYLNFSQTKNTEKIIIKLDDIFRILEYKKIYYYYLRKINLNINK